MVETGFVFGCSGSGKTTATRFIRELFEKKNDGWSVSRFNDYKIMYEWFLNDNKHRWFLPTEHIGFDILVPEIYDLTIEELTRKIAEHKPSEHELRIIDFARWDYSSSLKLLGKDLLQPAYFLFLKVDLEICVQRVQQRACNPLTIDDHFVPESVFECFRRQGENYIASTASILKTMYGVNEQKIWVIDNNTTPQNLYRELEKFVDCIKSKPEVEKDAGLSNPTNEPAFI